MQVTVEYEEIERLKQELQDARKDVKTLQDKLALLDADKLQRAAIEHSYSLFRNYFDAICKKLGFDNDKMQFIDIDRHMLDHYYKNGWFKDDDFELELGATITSKFQQAFLRIGVDTNLLKKRSI